MKLQKPSKYVCFREPDLLSSVWLQSSVSVSPTAPQALAGMQEEGDEHAVFPAALGPLVKYTARIRHIHCLFPRNLNVTISLVNV